MKPSLRLLETNHAAQALLDMLQDLDPPLRMAALVTAAAVTLAEDLPQTMHEEAFRTYGDQLRDLTVAALDRNAERALDVDDEDDGD